MISTTLVLSSLFASSVAVDALTPSVISTTSHDVKIAEIQKEFREKVAVPTSFSGKLEKYARVKVKESSINFKTTKFEDEETNLRGLKMKDNFLTFMSYLDNQCMTPHFHFGNLVNYCFNEQGEETGAKRSYINKVNLKENLAVEIQYEGYDCQGIPSKVNNLFYGVPEFNGWGNCFPGPDGAWYRVEYLDTYPMLMPGMYVMRTYPEAMCTTDNINYIEYLQLPLELLGIPLNTCVPNDPYYAIYSTSKCASDGQLLVEIYSDSSCTMLLASDTVYGEGCMPSDDDGDDDDDDDYDDDYELVGILETDICT